MNQVSLAKIIVISTGGTIEKSYDEGDGSLRNRHSQIQKHLFGRLRLPYTEIQLEVVMAKDSLDLTPQDRQDILRHIQRLEKEGCPMVILHGTDTMEITQKFCFDHHRPQVPVLFTGAMRPMDVVDNDAFQNVVEALALAKVLEAGFYVSFHNQLFVSPQVRKNRQKLTFEVGDPATE